MNRNVVNKVIAATAGGVAALAFVACSASPSAVQSSINLAVYKYYRHWSALALAKRNALEERVWAAQRAEMPGIIPSKVSETSKQITVLTRFQLYGADSSYTVTLPKKERLSR